MTTDTTQLAFGYNPGLVGATCAWGARWIITQDGSVDQLPDRQDMIGSPEEKAELLDWLNSDVGRKPRETLAKLLRSGEVSTRRAEEWCLYQDDRGIVIGNSNASAGYFYVVARFKTAKELEQDRRDASDAEEIMHGYLVGHYHPDHIAKYGSPS